MKRLKFLLVILALMFAVLSQAQVMEGNVKKREVLKMGLYPPDLIMRHQRELGITDAQRKQMSRAVKDFQSEVAELQWTLQSEQQALKQLLAPGEVDSDAALAQVDKVLALESSFKQAHFRLLISIKNALSDEQIGTIEERLKVFREKAKPN